MRRWKFSHVLRHRTIMRRNFIMQHRLHNVQIIYRVYKKTEQIWNHSQRREAAQSMNFWLT